MAKRVINHLLGPVNSLIRSDSNTGGQAQPWRATTAQREGGGGGGRGGVLQEEATTQQRSSRNKIRFRTIICLITRIVLGKVPRFVTLKTCFLE